MCSLWFLTFSPPSRHRQLSSHCSAKVMLGSGRKRGRSHPIASPLIPQRKRPTGAKSPGGTPGLPGGRAAIPSAEQDIVIDRLEKEVLPLLNPESTERRIVVRRRLRMGINEVTKYLEAAAAEQVSKNAQADPEKSGASGSALGSDSLCRSDSASGNSVDPKVADAASTPGSRSCAIVLICRDVRPARLVEHLHSLVALTGTPHLVLPGASGTLGRLFGHKTMAAFAICPSDLPLSETKDALKTAATTPRPIAPSRLLPLGTGNVPTTSSSKKKPSAVARPLQGQSQAKSPPERRKVEGEVDGGCSPLDNSRLPKDSVGERRPSAACASIGKGKGPDDRTGYEGRSSFATVHLAVDSFVDFLCRKAQCAGTPSRVLRAT